MKKLLILVFIFIFTFPTYAIDLTATVKEVHDGDTLTIEMCNNYVTKIRLIGVDAPELKQEYGLISKDFLKEILLNKQITIKTDKQIHDIYGRILGYVYLDKTFINLLLISEGLAISEPVSPNIKHIMDFNAAEQFAVKSIKGFWKTGGLKQKPKDFRHSKIKSAPVKEKDNSQDTLKNIL